MALRPYQETLLMQVRNALGARSDAKVMMQLPTGGGKTIIAGALLAEWLTGRRKAVWLTHRRELADQTCRMLTDTNVTAMTDVLWRPASPAPAMAGGAVILMAQTVGRRNGRDSIWGRYFAEDLLVIDEAHHATAPGYERAIRQWPGPVLGMTATPWRLSLKEGFDHLFDTLLPGPQVAELQRDGWLCHSRLVTPPLEKSIVGGQADQTGDYTETGIEQANRPYIMTAGVLELWRTHARGRPTIAYAVSVGHANNLAAVFNDAGIPAKTLLGDMNRVERGAVIEEFRSGRLKVLVNVVVATEGFDLPDASCIIMARPTLSLALYMQMIGRGLRPKGGGDCLLLDAARNAFTHGLAEDPREWSLETHPPKPPGIEPIVRCPNCEGASPAASQHCQHCQHSFGKDCDRCGKWRARRHWRFETHCDDAHQLVCDLCHVDAHREAHLPVKPPLDELLDASDPRIEPINEASCDLEDQVAVVLQRVLQREVQRIGAANETQCREVREFIANREEQLANNEELDRSFKIYIESLPPDQRPTLKPDEFRLYSRWIKQLEDNLATLKEELADLEGRTLDKQTILNRARETVLALLYREAQAADLLPPHSPVVAPAESATDIDSTDSPDGRPPTDSNPLPVTVFIEASRRAPRARALFYHNRKIIVMTDSLVVKDESLKLPESTHRLRLKLIHDNILIDEGNIYRFANNYSFKSPSEAACMVTGRSANGWREWRTANGVPLESFRREP